MICTMDGVRELNEAIPVVLRRDDESGRLVLRAFNEAGFAGIDVDLLDIIEWLARLAPSAVDQQALAAALIAKEHSR